MVCLVGDAAFNIPTDARKRLSGTVRNAERFGIGYLYNYGLYSHGLLPPSQNSRAWGSKTDLFYVVCLDLILRNRFL